eukprot:m.42217 g.42217  ORF g.42217 m.42217 type:complete len:57 (+) comp33341_c0_seq2:294-464(+)
MPNLLNKEACPKPFLPSFWRNKHNEYLAQHIGRLCEVQLNKEPDCPGRICDRATIK